MANFNKNPIYGRNRFAEGSHIGIGNKVTLTQAVLERKWNWVTILIKKWNTKQEIKNDGH